MQIYTDTSTKAGRETLGWYGRAIRREINGGRNISILDPAAGIGWQRQKLELVGIVGRPDLTLGIVIGHFSKSIKHLLCSPAGNARAR